MFSSVLIIDNRKELSTKYKKSLDNIEINSFIARTLKDAMISLQYNEPDMVIISDSIDEDLAGFCQKIRALTFNTRPIIIALSKSADYNDRIKILENGADDFISEPVNIEEFKIRIKAHFRRELETNLENKTQLPNKKLTYKALKRAINADNKAVLIVGFENLDFYKDVYTEVAGDKIIKTFIAIVQSAVDSDDFLGQIGEKNFIIITNRYSAEKLATFLTFAFDTVAPKFYSSADVQRGYMLIKNNHQAGMRVNFVSISIGGIVEGFSSIQNAEGLIAQLFSLKKLAKLPAGSNYTFKRVKLTGKYSISNIKENKKIFIKEDDESLKFLLKTSFEIQGYDVTEDINEDITPKILIIDSGEELKNLEYIKDLRHKSCFNQVKIIVTSAIHDKTAVLDSGADLYIPKPYEIINLIEWIKYFSE